MNFESNDFVLTPRGVKYLGSDFSFQRPHNLTKKDLATVLSVVDSKSWLWTYKGFSREQLLREFCELVLFYWY